MRRILDFDRSYPGARRVILATNYRCPRSVVDASRRVIEHNRERFAKPIRPAPAAAAAEDAIAAVAADPGWEDRLAEIAARSPSADATWCFLGRTRADVEPMLRALVRLGIRHRTALRLPLEAEPVQRLLLEVSTAPPGAEPFAALRQARRALGWRRGDPRADDLSDDDHAALDAALGWAVGAGTLADYLEAASAASRRLALLHDPAASIEVGTVHAAKGREWSAVVLVGWEEDRFPNRRALLGGADPERALEEERRLAYVALTRATRRVLLVFDPARPSPFLAEMGYGSAG